MNSLKEKDFLQENNTLNRLQIKIGEKGMNYILLSLLCCFLGFGFSCFDSFNDISPFAAAFLSAVPFNFCFASFSGSAVGYMLSVTPYACVRYIGALAVICLFRLVMAKRFSDKEGSLVGCFVSFCSVLVSGMIYLWVEDVYLDAFLILVCESILTLVSSYLFLSAFRIPFIKGTLSSLSKRNMLSLGLSSCICLMCLSSLDFQGVSPGRILTSVLLMFLSSYKGIGAGTVYGALTGAFLSLAPDKEYLFPAFVLSCLVAGFLSESGQTVISLSFTAVSVISTVMLSDISETLTGIIEPVIACVIYLVIPADKISDLEEAIDKITFTPKSITDIAVSHTLKTASDNIGSVAKIVGEVSDKLDKIINPEVNRLFSSLQQRVCDGCEKKAYCWNKAFDNTASDILSIMGVEHGKEGRIGLSVSCKRYDLLCNAVSASYPSYSAAIASKNKVSEMRSLLTDQFTGLSDFLSELSENVSKSRTRDKGKSVYLKTVLGDSGISVENLDCYFFRGRVSVELFLDSSVQKDATDKIKTIMEFVTKRRFEEPSFEVRNGFLFVCFKEKASYRIKSGFAQRALKAGNLCGDSVAVFTSGFNYFNAVISDGMGTGSRAAVDSTMTVSLIEKLVCSDFSFQSSLKMVNSALIMKSTDESISTVDAVCINPYTCKATFFKAGGAASFIRQGDNVTVIEKTSLPLGIIRDVPIACEERELKKGDIILMVSDGVTNSDCGWINDEMLAWSKSDMQSLAVHIASLARLRSEKNNRDDITVVALKIEKE